MRLGFVWDVKCAPCMAARASSVTRKAVSSMEASARTSSPSDRKLGRCRKIADMSHAIHRDEKLM